MYPNFCIIDPCLISASDYLILKSLSTETSLNVSLLHPGYRSWFSFFLDLRISICFRLCSCRQDLYRPPPSLHEVFSTRYPLLKRSFPTLEINRNLLQWNFMLNGWTTIQTIIHGNHGSPCAPQINFIRICAKTTCCT